MGVPLSKPGFQEIPKSVAVLALVFSKTTVGGSGFVYNLAPLPLSEKTEVP